MVEVQLIEGVLSSLFEVLKLKLITTPKDRAKFDFIIRGKDDQKIAIEVRGNGLNVKALRSIEHSLRDSDSIKEFYLISPEKPNKKLLSVFESVLRNVKINTYWLSINEFLEKQDLDLKFTKDLRNSLLNVQVAALTSKYDAYSKNHIGADVGYDKLAQNFKDKVKQVNTGKIDKTDVRFGLRRQFPDSLIYNLENDSQKISKYLNFGNKYDDAIIILTDIKNFSTIVSAADPDELNELMSKYYTNARELVYKYGGVLDKFIGDAVLAIFNYPVKNKDSFKKATKFCSELILMGKELLDDFKKKLDQEIHSGTRIGMATGPIYALNIGRDDFEVTFIGDKINFAARLEKNSTVDGILLSNRFYYKMEEYDLEFLESIDLEEVKIEAKDAKGQIGNTTAWQIKDDQLSTILK